MEYPETPVVSIMTFKSTVLVVTGGKVILKVDCPLRSPEYPTALSGSRLTVTGVMV